jgi:hypothetical protein
VQISVPLLVLEMAGGDRNWIVFDVAGILESRSAPAPHFVAKAEGPVT